MMKILKMKAWISIFLIFIDTVVTLELVPALDKNCRSNEVCATRESCSYWEDWYQDVKNLPKRNPELQQYISEARNAICNKKRYAVCCPNPVDISERVNNENEESNFFDR